MKQTTDTILMIEPVAFYFNAETAENNFFQKQTTEDQGKIQAKALSEFNGMVQLLRDKGITVITVKDTLKPHTPDSIFPNNWISMHSDGLVGIFPMYAENRRTERREDVLDILEDEGYIISSVIDYSSAEEEGIFLEGTGSLILDRENRLAYVALSARSDEDLVIEFCEDFEYTPIIFNANQTVNGHRVPIYHTNVMMCVAENYVVICLDTIDNKSERKMVVETILASGKEIVKISEEQMHQFAGNMLQITNGEENFLVMSKTAFESLNDDQIAQIERHDKILTPDIPTIEMLGGGSVRCMMAEVFLPKEQ